MTSVLLKSHCLQAALEIKKAQALDYLASQQEQTKWDLERPLDRFIEPLNQVCTLPAALSGDFDPDKFDAGKQDGSQHTRDDNMCASMTTHILHAMLYKVSHSCL